MADNSNAVPLITYGYSQPHTAVHTAVSNTDYTALASDTIIGFTSLSANRTVALPPAASVPAGKQLIIKDELGSCAPSRTITVSGTIDGAPNVVLNSAHAKLHVYSNGTAWSRIGG